MNDSLNGFKVCWEMETGDRYSAERLKGSPDLSDSKSLELPEAFTDRRVPLQHLGGGTNALLHVNPEPLTHRVTPEPRPSPQ